MATGRSVIVLIAAAIVVVGCSSSVPPTTGSTSPSAPVASVAQASAAASSAAAPSEPPSPSPSDEPATTPEATASDVAPTDEPSEEPMEGTAGPGCGTGHLGLFTHREELPREWHFGGATIQFTSAGIGLRNGTYSADDVIPAGLGLEPNELAVRVDPGTHILLRATGVTLTKLDVVAVPWETVTFSGGLGSSDADGLALAWRLRSDGSISVSAPDQPGDYMVDFHPLWQTACLEGDGSAYSRIKVNG